VALVIAAWALSAAAALAAASDAVPPTEQEVKAAYLYNFAKYVEWPQAAAPEQQWVVGVLGDGDFGEVLQKLLAGKTARERPFVARRLLEPEQAAQAHIVFIAASEAPRLPAILKSLEGSRALTVSDIDGFAEKGGMIGFRMDGKKVRFDISPQAATRAGLRISSQLLALARVVQSR
jgi:uncharacterized protein DUF4154